MHAAYPLTLASLLAAVGVYGALTRRHVIMLLLSLELVLAGANLALVTMGAVWQQPGQAGQPGQVFALFVLTIAAAEMGVGLAVILLLFGRTGTNDLPQWNALGPRFDDELGHTPDTALSTPTLSETTSSETTSSDATSVGTNDKDSSLDAAAQAHTAAHDGANRPSAVPTGAAKPGTQNPPSAVKQGTQGGETA